MSGPSKLDATHRALIIVSSLLFTIVCGLVFWRSYTGVPLLQSLAVSNSSSIISPVWDIGDLGEVRMLSENTKRYELADDGGAEAWEKLVPKDGGIIYRRNPSTGEVEDYTISMFHQLRCLTALRAELLRPTRFETPRAPNEPILKHCFNYIRQMVLCRSDTYLENLRKSIGENSLSVTPIRICKDWRKVYEAVENQYY
ncbi:hypothetical protein SCHPADRAFT_125398 [Schizopora paradoxa]|uniref:Uncharacterized protein n=1 Tax=Schizopora paradoxa TaxID=27342 RepID=A0A0H2S2V3_9AGAM|nr:hypothetical protein SCHPADRAFT_125398 [Schizopora paradoxa]